jgi:uncharacterized protein YoxC
MKRMEGTTRNSRGVSNVLFAVSATILIIASIAVGLTIQSKYDQLQNNYQNIQTQLSSLQKQLNNLQSSYNQLLNQIISNSTSINGIEMVEIEGVSISGNMVTIYARSTGGSNVTFTSAILKDSAGNIIAEENQKSATLPASGAATAIELSFSGITISGIDTVTLVSSKGNSFASLSSPINVTEKVEIKDASISGNTVTVYASSTGGSDVSLTNTFLKDSSGIIIGVDDQVSATLLGSGILTTIQLNFSGSTISSGSYTVTLISSKGGTFVSRPFMAP